MKSKFPGYFRPTEEEIKELWESAIFTLDANVLLHLYRYSDDTRDELFKILDKIKDRIWISHQAAKEFFENKLNVIGAQEKAYDEAITALNKIENGFKSARQHPFIRKKLLKKFSKVAKEICEELSSNKETHSKRILEDEVLARVENLLKDKVGDAFSEEQLEKHYKTGKERFDKRIPPGFKDAANKSNNREYGDFILWQQILDYATETKKNIILISNDKKEDWWNKFNGKTLHPHPHLIKEFQDKTGMQFYMYQSDRFLSFARDFYKQDVSQEAIDEIKNSRVYLAKESIGLARIYRKLAKYNKKIDALNEEKLEAETFIKDSNDQIRLLVAYIQHLQLTTNETEKGKKDNIQKLMDFQNRLAGHETDLKFRRAQLGKVLRNLRAQNILKSNLAAREGISTNIDKINNVFEFFE